MERKHPIHVTFFQGDKSWYEMRKKAGLCLGLGEKKEEKKQYSTLELFDKKGNFVVK